MPKSHHITLPVTPNRSCQKAVAKAERSMNKYGLENVGVTQKYFSAETIIKKFKKY